MKNRNAVPIVAFIVMCIGAFCAPYFWPRAEAQRGGYVEKRAGGSAFANQLAPNPVAGYMLTPVGTDTNQVTWTNPGTGLPSGSLGQIPQVANTTGTYTYTATGTQTLMTGTQTTTTTEWKATTGTIDFDPMGTFFLGEAEGARAVRLKDLPNVAWPATFSGTCSSGADALLGSFAIASYEYEYRKLWPAGTWMANLIARVDANGAAVRIEVWDQEFGGSATQWFNWTTDVFTRTSNTTIVKMSSQGERTVATSPGHYIVIKLYATCSTSTLVTVDEARVESPIVADVPTNIGDVKDLQSTLDGKEATISAGLPGQVVGYAGTGTTTTTSKGPLDREPLLSGTPGQFVKIAGTGTSTTTSKEAATIYSTSTPVAIATSGSVGTATTVSRSDHTHSGTVGLTTRVFTVPASALGKGSGAVLDGTGNTAVWTLRDSQSDYTYGGVVTVPADYASGMTVSPLWYPAAVDSNQSHTVKWSIGTNVLSDAAGESLSYSSWTGKACGSACPASWVLVVETPVSFGSYSAGDSVAIGIKRLGSDAGDTYVGSVELIGLKFSYTSSL